MTVICKFFASINVSEKAEGFSVKKTSRLCKNNIEFLIIACQQIGIYR